MRELGVVRRAEQVKAFLLAAGLGTRLRPLTDDTPKCMLPWTASLCSTSGLTPSTGAGVDEVLVNLHYLPEVVRRHLRGRAEPPLSTPFSSRPSWAVPGLSW